MPELTLTSSAPAGDLLRHLSFGAALPGHTKPGQYVTVSVPGHEPAFFALANRPGTPVELLVKGAGDAAEVLAALSPGESVQMTDASGPGFGVDPFGTDPVVILANGSGISAVRPVVESLLPELGNRSVTFLYGVLTTAHRSFLADLERWARVGVQVRTVVGGSAEDWTGDLGYVQDVAHELGLFTPNATVVLCGVPPMIDAARALCAAAGVPDAQVRVNF